MNSEISEQIRILQDLMAINYSPLTVAVDVRITHRGANITIEERTAERLKEDGISMRNLAGHFIK